MVSCLTSDHTTATMTNAATPILILDGTHSLLLLASKVVHSLHSHYDQQYQTALTAGDEDSEVENVENLNDVELTLQELDPVYWKELVDRRLQSTGEVVKSCHVRKCN
jgi:hypothetical protein